MSRPRAVVRPKGAEAKLTGTGRYPSDLAIEGALHAAVLRSPHPHAVVTAVDGVAAASGLGVHAVLTRRDLGLDDRVRQVGDVVAAVAADTPALAEAALAALVPRYEVLPAVLDPAAALAGGTLLYDDRADNVALAVDGGHGDPASAIAEAHIVLRRTYRTGRPAHANLARRCCVATLGADGTLEMLTSVDAPRFAQRELAAAVGLDADRVRIVLPELLTSSFGGRSGISPQCEPIAARLALALPGRPVRLLFSAEEELTVAHTRHATEAHVVVGATADGRITALDLDVIVDHGAFPTFVARIVLANLRDRPPAQYQIPHYRFRGRAVLTNNVDAGEMRAIGSMQAMFAASSAVDDVARALDLDPVTVHRRNAAHPSIDRCLEEGARAFGWSGSIPQEGAPDRVRGVGVGVGHHTTGLGTFHGPDRAGARITVAPGGRVRLAVAAPDSGQGAATVYAQIAASELGCAYSDVELEPFRSDRAPPDPWGSVASRGVYVVGAAVRQAARDARRRLAEPTADGGEIVVEAAVEVDGNPPTFGACFVEVEVDTGTGRIQVVRAVAAFDVGRVLNAQQCVGQIEGGVAFGLEHVIGAQVELDGGTPRHRSVRQHRLVRASDLRDVRVVLVESADPGDPAGAQGVGTPAITPVAAAVCSAIRDAIGVPVTSIPVSPAALVDLLDAAGA